MIVEKTIEKNGVKVTYNIVDHINGKTLEQNIENIFIFSYFDKLKTIIVMIMLFSISMVIGFLLYFGVIESIFFYALGVLCGLGFILRVLFFNKIIEKNNQRVVDEYNTRKDILNLLNNKKCSWNLLVDKEHLKNKTIFSSVDIFLSNEFKESANLYWRKEFDMNSAFKKSDVNNSLKLSYLSIINKLNIIKNLAKRDLIQETNNLMPNVGIYYDIYDGNYYIVMKKELIPDGYEDIFNNIVEKIKQSNIFKVLIVLNDKDIHEEVKDKERRKDEIKTIVNYVNMVPNFIREKDLQEALKNKKGGNQDSKQEFKVKKKI